MGEYLPLTAQISQASTVLSVTGSWSSPNKQRQSWFSFYSLSLRGTELLFCVDAREES